MMKYLIIIITVFSLNSSYTQKRDTLVQISNNTKIENLNQRIDDLEADNLSKNLIQEYKDLNNIYSFGFGILIGLFGIVFPLLLYLIQIKPSQQVLKDAKKLIKKIDEDFEKSFEEHLKKSKNNLINQAIESFENQSEHQLPTSYTILDSYKGEGFTEMQVFRLIKLLNRKDGDKNNNEFFASLLTFQEDENIENYYIELINSNPKNELNIWGAIYFANYNKVQYYDLVAVIVIHGYSLTGMIASLSDISKTFAVNLLDNRLLVEKLSEKEIKNYGQFGAKSLKEKINSEIVENTLLMKKYNSID